MKVAILGAGATGTCAALELAARGCPVDLYDENTVPVWRASRINEGKIHCGILYAKDTSRRTARLMIEGALSFSSDLSRWIDWDDEAVTLSTPFYYAVHNETMVGVDHLQAHYAACREIFDAVHTSTGHAYLNLEKALLVEQLRPAELADVVDPSQFVTAFRTSERAVDPRPIAAALRRAVASEPKIRFVGDARIVGVSRRSPGEAIEVKYQVDGAHYQQRYDQVANTLWHGRLEIDAGIGLTYRRPWLYRYKLGSRVFIPLAPESVPSITCVLGPFGDVVNFGDRGLFLSWYPIGMMATSQDLRPPEWETTLSAAHRYEMFRRSYQHWTGLCRSVGDLGFLPADVDPSGAVIFTWGSTGIDDDGSELHNRYEIGIHSEGNYHSVDTGKYTMAPYFGRRTAERILGPD